KNRHGFDWGHCDGGNGDMSTAYFARGIGPVNESDDPYNVSSNVSPVGLVTQKLLTQAIIIPPRADSLDNDTIKQAILDYGAVQSSYYSSSSTSYYRSATASYYYNGTNTSNHAITLVGWDDNYDKSNFATVPPGNGAFIVRNSWGTYWGQSGYFYMSYYDSKIGNDNYQFRGLEPVSKYVSIYQHDPLGITYAMGSGTSTTYWFANIFTAAGTESITAAGFHAASAGSTYDWYVYTGVTSGPRTGTLAASGTGQTLTFPGYHVVPLSPVAITAGQKFSVVIKLTTPGYNYPVPLEYPYPGYATQATASAGQSYYSGNGLSWSDMTSYLANTNVALKALSQYAVTANVSGGNGTISSLTPAYIGTGGSVTFTLVPDAGYQLIPDVAGSCPTGTFTGNDYTTGTISGSCTVTFSFAPEGARKMTLSVSGAGGSISSTPAPPGGVCTTICNQYFADGEVVSLTPTPPAGAFFSGWSGDCSGSGTCQVTMDGAKSVTAIFEWEQNVKNSATGSTHGLIGPVYDLLAGGETVMVKAGDFSGDLSFNRSISFTLKGGYDNSFLEASSLSTIHGSLAVIDGSVTLENIILAP
ncbi:MAG TPA: lectin like domain-containing protein, partial [Geobacteraceae bacterium]|nr:lectin like domain-containing protein [Geobacteraceae bacterium]